MHPINGVPQLQHDQLNTINTHLAEMKEEINDQWDANGTYEITPIIQKLTRKHLKLADNCYKRKEVEYIQLDNYKRKEKMVPHKNFQKTQIFSTYCGHIYSKNTKTIIEMRIQ